MPLNQVLAKFCQLFAKEYKITVSKYFKQPMGEKIKFQQLTSSFHVSWPQPSVADGTAQIYVTN